MPENRAEIEALLHFLDDGLYKAPLSKQNVSCHNAGSFPRIQERNAQSKFVNVPFTDNN